MKVKSFLPRLVSAAMVLSLAVGCNKSDNDDDTAAVTYTEADNAIMKNWVDNVVLATYKVLDAKALALKTALEKLRDTPSQANFDAARDAWVAVRIPWEQSEGFISGPVDDLGLDPAIDTWPFVSTDIAATLAKVAANETVDIATLEEGQKGFHAVEYFLYGVDNTMTFANSKPVEQKYMVMLADNIHKNTGLILDSWNVSFDEGPGFRERFLNSGVKSPAPHASTSAAIDHIVERMHFIVSEVGDTKIAAPHNKEEDGFIESEYSDRSIKDFQDNIRSVQHVYRGSIDGEAVEASISTRVKTRDASLDADVEDLFEASIAAIGAIPGPFRISATDPAATDKVDAAIEKLSELFDILQNKVAPASKE